MKWVNIGESGGGRGRIRLETNSSERRDGIGDIIDLKVRLKQKKKSEI